jgi:hypothetical protein
MEELAFNGHANGHRDVASYPLRDEAARMYTLGDIFRQRHHACARHMLLEPAAARIPDTAIHPRSRMVDHPDRQALISPG